MLASASLYISQLQLPQISLRLIPFQPLPPSNYRNKSSINANKILKSPCFSSKTPSISTQVENPDAESPDSLYSLSIERFLHPNVLALMLQSCLDAKEARGIHTIIAKGLGRSITFVDNNLISTYGRFGEVADARRVFDKMSDRDVVSWTAMLKEYLKIGANGTVCRLFKELIESGVQANSSTFVCVLNMCGRKLDLELGEQIHASIVKGNCSNLIVDSALVFFYAQCGDLMGALRVFDRMPERDVVCWTTMITACAQHGYGDEAISMFSQMQFDGFSPNEFTVCSTLKACGEEKALKFGRQLHGAIVKKIFKDDVFVGSSLVGMYVRCGQVLDARIVFDRMRRRNTVTWTTMIAGYAQNGLGEEAIRLFQRMKRRRVFANTLTAVSVLSACGLIGSLSMGKEVHAKILKNMIENNLYIGSTLVWFYCKCGEYVHATRVLESMPLRDVVTWTAIISGYARLGHGSEALQSLNDMLWEGVEPNPFTYSSALKACAKQEAVRQGKWIHSSANKTHALSNVYVGSSLIDMYAKCGCLEDAIRVFDRMPERNLVSWKAMIIGYARNGHCQEALKLMYRMQAEGIEVDDFILATVVTACGDFERDSEGSQTSCLQSS
ncbi:pentatricopeptide repeat-containing protein At4g18520, chloroplastic-like [Magnolia sinica]|uniref:pentatricopeptide repeat-containing protein At4g18520, chloroplastic-like n=1 Tax=Magnolia sinica TaxID=86752 RepID=UPI002659F008|nr:pentatricopeptide repeat-containing protein At4g18520, chloroplastic-like [Magnolia sinica]